LTLPPADERRASKQQAGHQSATRAIIGSLGFIDKVMPRLTKPLHNLRCVQTQPSRLAYDCARAILADAYDHRKDGITYGGNGLSAVPRLEGGISAAFKMDDGAPAAMEATADATWSDKSVFGILLTMFGGAVAHLTKLINLIIDSSAETEAIATAKAGELIESARNVLVAMGYPPVTATFLGSDNSANAALASGRSNPSRLRHAARRYTAFLQRVARGNVEVGHVRDEENPSDFLTKFIKKDKVKRSLEFATNARNYVRQTKGGKLSG